MDKGFIFNNRSSLDFDIYFKSVDRTLLPPLIRKEVSIPERDGVYDFGSRFYGNRKLEIECFIKSGSLENLRRKIREIADWLSIKGKLIFPDEPNRYYIGRIYSEVALSQINTHGSINLIFECEPYAYSDDIVIAVNDITTASEVVIANRGVTSIKPIIIIDGTATSLTIATDTESITIASITTKTYIDIEKCLCYTIDPLTEQKVNKLNDISGDIKDFALKSGISAIEISGTAFNIDIEVTIREKYL